MFAVERPEPQARRCRGRRDQRVGDLDPMRPRISGEVATGMSTDPPVENDLPAGFEERARRLLFTRAYAGVYLRP